MTSILLLKFAFLRLLNGRIATVCIICSRASNYLCHVKIREDYKVCMVNGETELRALETFRPRAPCRVHRSCFHMQRRPSFPLLLYNHLARMLWGKKTPCKLSSLTLEDEETLRPKARIECLSPPSLVSRTREHQDRVDPGKMLLNSTDYSVVCEAFLKCHILTIYKHDSPRFDSFRKYRLFVANDTAHSQSHAFSV